MASASPDPPSATSTPIIELIAKLPSELSGAIFSHLPNSDIKKLRLVSRRFVRVAGPHLRFARVFISANPRNIEVFRAIADHETFRQGVHEIVWDDARFAESLGESSGYSGEPEINDYTYNQGSDDDLASLGVPSWFAHACQENIEYLRSRRGRDRQSLPQHVESTQQLAAQLPLDVAYAYYYELFKQQEDGDVDARGSWGPLYPPIPDTHDSGVPYGFNYPIPRSWPTPVAEGRAAAEGWEDEATKNKWRGFRIIARVLAQQQQQQQQQQRTKVSEFIIDGSQIKSGLTCEVFQPHEPSEEYHSLATMVKKPGFSTLKLTLMIYGQDWQSYPAFRSGHLKQALTADLRSFTLETDEEMDEDSSPAQPTPRPDRFIPLRTIFPVESWTHLSHFGLSRFLVKQKDVLDFLAVLPDTLRSAELSFLFFMNDSGNYQDLLTGIRDSLGWRERLTRPKVSIRTFSSAKVVGRFLCIYQEVQEFLYGSGENPFTHSPGGNWVHVKHDLGIEQDAFEPRFERPTGFSELTRLGIR